MRLSALKACIAKATRRHEFPDRKKAEASYKHDLRELVRAAKLDDSYADELKRDVRFKDNWKFVQSWSEASRYQTNSENDTSELILAITDGDHGVMQWVKKHW